MQISKPVCAIGFSAAALLVMTGCGRLDLRLHKAAVEEGRSTGVTARLRNAEPNVEVKFQVTSGQECGTLSAASATTSDAGAATVNFTGAREIEECKATIQATAQGQTASTSLYVNKLPLTKVRIDGVSVLVLFLIASFAIDRIVRGWLFVLSFFTFWRRRVPYMADLLTDPGGARNQRLAYVAMAGVLAIFALGWIGKVRMLAALGFAQVDPLIDTCSRACSWLEELTAPTSYFKGSARAAEVTLPKARPRRSRSPVEWYSKTRVAPRRWVADRAKAVPSAA